MKTVDIYIGRCYDIGNDKVLFTLTFPAPDFGRTSGIILCKIRAGLPCGYIRRRLYSERQIIFVVHYSFPSRADITESKYRKWLNKKNWIKQDRISERNLIIKSISTVRLLVRCYIVLSRNLSLIFSLISTRKVLWVDIKQGKI